MDRSLVIRQAQKSDIAALSELAIKTYTEAFGHTFSEADLAAHLKKRLSPGCFSRMLDEDVVLLAEVEGRLVGYAQFGATDLACTQDKDQELRRLYVDAAFQNQGYCAALMEAALNHPRLQGAENIYLDVWEHNHGAQRFYRRFGFEVVGTRTFEVESGVPTSLDLIMARRSSKERKQCPMSPIITRERPDTVDAVNLIAELEAHLTPFYPPESCHGYSVEKLIAENVAFFLIRVDDTPAGCGGVQLFGTEYAEVKRMYVRPQFRGSGLGKLMLDHLAEYARSQGVRLLRLETGIHQREAIGLYDRMGFERIPPFGTYWDDPLSLFYEKRLP